MVIFPQRLSPSRRLDLQPAAVMRAIGLAIAVICLPAVGAELQADYDFHYLAANPALRAQLTNADVSMNQATYVDKVLELDQDWENPFWIGYLGSVLKDSGSGQWRMYYELGAPGQEFQRGVALAVSNDGVNWTKPALNITGTRYTTSPQNNFVKLPFNHMGGPCVFEDPNAPLGQRYRMSATVDEKTLYAMTSGDGVNWTTSGVVDDRGSSAALDSLNATFWDPLTQNYREYGRWWYGGGYGGRRGVYMKEANTWDGVWTGSRQYILDPLSMIPAGSRQYFDIYTPSIQPYHGQYIGLPAVYHHPGSWSASGPIYPSFMYSANGTDWSFHDAYQPIIDLAAHGQNEENFGMAFPATSIVEHDGMMYIYYSYFPENHSESRSSGEIHLATLPQDRFVGIGSTPGKIGTWTTSPITLSDDPVRLIVNAVVDASLYVEVLDTETDTPISGFSLNDSTPLTPGDFINAMVKWGGVGDLAALAGRTVSLRFTMDEATVYGFRFQTVPEPAPFVLLSLAAFALMIYGKCRIP